MESLTKKELLAESPRKNGNFLSFLTFRFVKMTLLSPTDCIYVDFVIVCTSSWVLPILLKGRKKVLGLEDLYQPLDSHLADNLGNKLEKAWDEEKKKKISKNKQPILMSAGLKVFGFEIGYLGCILMASELLFKTTMPVFLGGVVKYYSNPEKSSINDAYWYSAGIIACSFCTVLVQHSLMLTNITCGMRIRVAACSMIYRKSLRLSKSALINTTSGQVVNLLSNDVGR